ncbi:hypothetical protein MABM_17450 [Mycobacteroides abscessus]|uniref:hypothetical protein n=1 Tax=Mycobacteroides abscessus TaxID=36809 RepID=UPI0013019924|nr:hypothetical protein [Mycobacteroides abscessus]BBZ81829.1 hypothetical protein MABM_17450 [Mycobacteroides abscessus]
MSDWETENEVDVIYRILDKERVRDALNVANRVHSALIKRRMLQLAHDYTRREQMGLT